jgi:hypothetical protein
MPSGDEIGPVRPLHRSRWGPTRVLLGPVLKVAHRGVPWAAFAEAPALPTPPGSTSTEFDTPGAKAPNFGT